MRCVCTSSELRARSSAGSDPLPDASATSRVAGVVVISDAGRKVAEGRNVSSGGGSVLSGTACTPGFREIPEATSNMTAVTEMISGIARYSLLSLRGCAVFGAERIEP